MELFSSDQSLFTRDIDRLADNLTQYFKTFQNDDNFHLTGCMQAFHFSVFFPEDQHLFEKKSPICLNMQNKLINKLL